MAHIAKDLIQHMKDSNRDSFMAEVYDRVLETSCVLLDIDTGDHQPWPDDCDDQADYVQALCEIVDSADNLTEMETVSGVHLFGIVR